MYSRIILYKEYKTLKKKIKKKLQEGHTSPCLVHSTRALAGSPVAKHVIMASTPARILRLRGLTVTVIGVLVAASVQHYTYRILHESSLHINFY